MLAAFSAFLLLEIGKICGNSGGYTVRVRITMADNIACMFVDERDGEKVDWNVQLLRIACRICMQQVNNSFYYIHLARNSANFYAFIT